MALHIVILAAGEGKRMRSVKPKVLHSIAGKPMLTHVIETAQSLNPAKIHVLIGHQYEEIRTTLASFSVHWILQEERLGTGHAVMQALPHIPEESLVLILSGDVPLIQATTLQTLIQEHTHLSLKRSTLSLLLANYPDPTGFGRIVRDQNKNIIAIVEEKDATPEQRKIHEIYSGICCTEAAALQQWLPQLTRHNAQGEYYLTEILMLAVNNHSFIHAHHVQKLLEIQGVNTKLQLQQLERAWQTHRAETLMLQGVTIADAARIDIRGQLHCGQDVFIDINTVFMGDVSLGDSCSIGSNCILNNVTLGANCKILANSILENCFIDEGCEIGPFARLRPDTRLAPYCKVGNFVEVKNTSFGRGSKANHLSYLGDAVLGSEVNIGAGTITCNYDGANKHQTIIEDGVHIGSDTQLVAPVVIGQNATIGAGSTIRRNVPAGELTLTESAQKTVYGWQRKKKSKSLIS